MTTHTSHTAREIQAQTGTLRETLARLSASELPAWVEERDRTPVFVGCGTSHYLALYGAAVTQVLAQRPAVALTGSEAWLLADQTLRPWNGPFLVALSRSGATTEVVRAAAEARRRGIPVLGITTTAGSELAQLADASLVLDHVREQSVVMTQSFSNMLLALQWLAARIAGGGRNPAAASFLGRLPEVAEAVARLHDRLAAEARRVVGAGGHGQYVFLGSGAFYGVAREGMLKMKEMTQLPADAYVTLEFRHGPKAIVTPRTCVVVLSSRSTAAHDRDLAAEVAALGGKAVVLAEEGTVAPGGGVEVVALPPGYPEAQYASLYTPFLQWLAFVETERLGLDPDRPRHLSQVVRLGAGA
ncbi:MAG: SIS domain-containing protein [Symbiobacteriaceae bacterium]